MLLGFLRAALPKSINDRAALTCLNCSSKVHDCCDELGARGASDICWGESDDGDGVKGGCCPEPWAPPLPVRPLVRAERPPRALEKAEAKYGWWAAPTDEGGNSPPPLGERRAEAAAAILASIEAGGDGEEEPSNESWSSIPPRP